MRASIQILSILFVVFALQGCNEGYPVKEDGNNVPVTTQSSTVVFVINPRAGYWTFSDRPDQMFVAAVTRTVTGTITATVHPNDPNAARFGEWSQAPGPTNGDTITITGNGAHQTAIATLAPAGNG